MISNILGLNIVDGHLILTLPDDIDNKILMTLKEGLLQKVYDSRPSGVIIDLSSISILTSYEFNELTQLIRMVRMFGVHAVMAGLKPGVVSALIDMDVNFDDIDTFLNVQQALDSFKVLNDKNDEFIDEEHESEYI